LPITIYDNVIFVLEQILSLSEIYERINIQDIRIGTYLFMMQILSTFRYCYLLGAAFALFFSILVFSKKNKTIADKILGAWLVVLFAQLIIPFLYLTDLNVYYKYAGYETAFYMFHPFLLYLYVKATIGELPRLTIIVWNVLAIVISEIFELSFMMYPAKERLLFIEGKVFLPLVYIPLIILMIGYFLYNIYASYIALKNYKNNVLQVYSYREDIELLWLRRIVMLFGAIIIFIFPMGLISYYIFHSLIFADYFFFVTLVIFIFLIGYWGYQQGEIFSSNNIIESLGTNSGHRDIIHMNDNRAELRSFKKEAMHLQEIVKNNKPYLEPALTIHDLARLVDMPPHVLSKVINKEFHSNFFEFINNFRIEEFKQKVIDKEYKNLTILGIALECGFNSKSAFNRIFKDITGLTPGDFIKNQKP
jgi:AraC-like DNA-binding protein